MKIPSVGDVVRLGAAPVEALVQLPERVAQLNRTLASSQQLPGLNLVSRRRGSAGTLEGR